MQENATINMQYGEYLVKLTTSLKRGIANV